LVLAGGKKKRIERGRQGGAIGGVERNPGESELKKGERPWKPWIF
jgi:hypothetical protein